VAGAVILTNREALRKMKMEIIAGQEKMREKDFIPNCTH
jgi:hypothetical protein